MVQAQATTSDSCTFNSSLEANYKLRITCSFYSGEQQNNMYNVKSCKSYGCSQVVRSFVFCKSSAIRLETGPSTLSRYVRTRELERADLSLIL